MNNKQLAEMIKTLRKEKMLKEYQTRAAHTSPQMTKTPSARKYAVDTRNQPKAGNDARGRYVPGVKTEEKKPKANNIINTTPEQDSAMIGTQ